MAVFNEDFIFGNIGTFAKNVAARLGVGFNADMIIVALSKFFGHDCVRIFRQQRPGKYPHSAARSNRQTPFFPGSGNTIQSHLYCSVAQGAFNVHRTYSIAVFHGDIGRGSIDTRPQYFSGYATDTLCKGFFNDFKRLDLA